MKQVFALWVVLGLAGCTEFCTTETALLKQENEFLKRENAKQAARILELENRLFRQPEKSESMTDKVGDFMKGLF